MTMTKEQNSCSRLPDPADGLFQHHTGVQVVERVTFIDDGLLKVPAVIPAKGAVDGRAKSPVEPVRSQLPDNPGPVVA